QIREGECGVRGDLTEGDHRLALAAQAAAKVGECAVVGEQAVAIQCGAQPAGRDRRVALKRAAACCVGGGIVVVRAHRRLLPTTRAPSYHTGLTRCLPANRPIVPDRSSAASPVTLARTPSWALFGATVAPDPPGPRPVGFRSRPVCPARHPAHRRRGQGAFPRREPAHLPALDTAPGLWP